MQSDGMIKPVAFKQDWRRISWFSIHSILDPYRNVVEAIDPDVRLVVVGGLAVFGDVDIMQAMDDEIQIIEGVGFTKATDITYDGVPEAQQTVDELLAELQSCNQGAPVPIEYLFTLGDDRYFDVLNRSLTFQKIVLSTFGETTTMSN